MEPFQIPATPTTPEIQLDSNSGNLSIQGVSDEVDALGFYFPILQWLEAYVQHPAEKTILNIKLSYFNTASSKSLFEVIKRLKPLQKNGNSLEINWFYNAEDPVLKEDIEQFCDLTSVPINVAGS